jgi:hypothetical protein
MGSEASSSTNDERDLRVTRLAAEWEAKDVAVAALAKDHDAARDARGLRELVCDLVLSAAPERELLTALHAFGHLLGEKGATPSAVSLTMDSGRAVLSASEAQMLGPSARAAVFEGYAAALRDLVVHESLGEWLPPAGIVRLSADAFAVAAHYPAREPDEISEWSTRVARFLKERGAKKVHVDGDPQLLRELRDTLLLAGMDVLMAPPGDGGDKGGPPEGGERTRGIFSKILG